MKKLPTRTILKLLPFCILITASIACRIADVGKMVGDEFLRKNPQLIPIIAPERVREYPDSSLGNDFESISSLSADDLDDFVDRMSADELEQFVDSLTSEHHDIFIQMLPADKQAELEKTEDAELGNLANMVGTYIGDGPITPNDWEALEKEYTFVVGEDGSVSGRFVHIYERYSPGRNCWYHRFASSIIEFNGQITEVISDSEAIGVATKNRNHYSFYDQTDCGGDKTYQTADLILEGYRITIIDDTIEFGPGEDFSGNVFRAKKQ